MFRIYNFCLLCLESTICTFKKRVKYAFYVQAIVIFHLHSMSSMRSSKNSFGLVTSINLPDHKNKLNKLNKPEKLKTLEKFNHYRKSGADFLTKEDIQRILESIGKSLTKEDLRQMVTDSSTIDQFYFQSIVSEYKVFTQESDDLLLRNVFDSMTVSTTDKIMVSALERLMLDDFGIDISEVTEQNKFYLSFEEFKAIFS